MKESNIQKLVMCELSKHGLVFRTNSGMARALTGNGFIKLLPEGFSDLIFLQSPGRLVFIEMKQLTGKQRESQINFQKLVENMGFEYKIVRKIDDLKSFL